MEKEIKKLKRVVFWSAMMLCGCITLMIGGNLFLMASGVVIMIVGEVNAYLNLD